MPNTKITDLTLLTSVDQSLDPLPIVDTSDTSTATSGTTKKTTVNKILDSLAGSTVAQGDIIYRGVANWTRLPAGTAGHYLQTQGAGANPQWAAGGGGGGGSGTVTSVGLLLPSIFSVSGTPVTTSGTLTGTLNTQNINLVFAGPASGSAATPTFRSLVPGDIPQIPISTGVSGLGTGVSTFLGTPTSANLAGAVTDETGSGSLVFATSPTLVTPNIGTPSAGTLTNCTGLPLSTGVTGDLPLANVVPASVGSILLGRGSSGAGDFQEITLGTNLSITGTTLNAAGGGGGSTNIWIPAAQWIPRTTTGCGINSLESTTNKVNYDVLEFDQATAEYAQAIVVMPSNWNAGTVTAKFHWTAGNATGTPPAVVWAINARAYGDASTIDAAMGTAVTITDTLSGANELNISSATSAMTIAGSPASGQSVIFQVYRDAANGSDTLTADARLIGVEISYTAA